MKTFAETGYDGTGRKPRPQQQEVFDWLEEVWNKYDVFAITAPVGSGKSLIARAIQRRLPRTRVLTFANYLVKAFKDDYPEVSTYMGVTNYENKNDYFRARILAADPDNEVITNPMALFFLKQSYPEFEDSDVVVLDEADAIIGLLSLLVVKRFPLKKSEYFRGGLADPSKLADFFEARVGVWKVQYDAIVLKPRVKLKTIGDLETKMERLRTVIRALRQEPERMAIDFNQNENDKWFVNVRPIRLPLFVFRDVFGKAKVVLLSATIFQSDVVEALPLARVAKLEVDSPIPVESRRVLYSPLSVDSWNPTPLEAMAQKLDAILDKYAHLRPALIHATYRDAMELSKLLKHEVMCYNDKKEKDETVKEWYEKGGILIGPGLSIGINLKDDLCRLNIVSKIQFPYLGDPYVKKKKALNPVWYDLQAAKMVVQALGRSTRNETDFSVGIIMDGRWSRLRARVGEHLPKFFLEQTDLFVTEIA